MAIATSIMTSRQRWLAALDFQEVDRLPFWPKLAGEVWNGKAKEYPDANLHQYIGSDEHIQVPPGLREVRTRSGFEQQRTANEQIDIFHTPNGPLRRRWSWDPAACCYHPVDFPLKTVADIEAMTAWYDDVRVELDEKQLAEVQALCGDIGERGSIKTTNGESPLMEFVEYLAGVDNAHYLLADHEAETLALFEAMQRRLLSRARLLAEHHPADMVYMIENTSTTLISPQQYRRYNWPHLKQVTDVFAAAGKRCILHMCGHLKAVLDDLEKLPVTGFESFTAPTLGNTTLLDGRTHCPTKALIGGTHAMIWLEPAERIVAFIEARLDELPHHRGIVVTSAGVMPPACPPERIKTVCGWLKDYRPRL